MNKRKLIFWKLSMIIPLSIGIWLVYSGWMMKELTGGILMFGGIIGAIFSIVLFIWPT